VSLPLLRHGVLPGLRQVPGDGLQQGALLLLLQLPPLLGQSRLEEEEQGDREGMGLQEG
jgi:hypothetical protein